MSAVPRILRAFDGDAHIAVYETLTEPPAGDMSKGDWAICLGDGDLVLFGPKIDDATWPAGAATGFGAAPPGSGSPA